MSSAISNHSFVNTHTSTVTQTTVSANQTATATTSAQAPSSIETREQETLCEKVKRICHKIFIRLVRTFRCLKEACIGIGQLPTMMRQMHEDRNRSPANSRAFISVSTNTAISGEEPRYYPGVRIDRNLLQLAPLPINYEELGRRYEREVTDLNELAGQVGRCFADQPEAARNRIRWNIQNFVEFAIGQSDQDNIFYLQSGDVENLNRYYRDLRSLLKGIIFQLRKPNELVSLEKKKVALSGLASSMEDCMPRRFEEARRQFSFLQPGFTADQRLLRYVQEFKEDLFIERFQRGEFHFINYIRFRFGELLGLDRSAMNLLDGSQNCYGPGHGRDIPDQEYIDYFNQNFTVERLVRAVRFKINLAGHSGEDFGPLLQTYIDRENIRDEAGQEIDAGARYFRFYGSGNDENGITEEGAVLLLRNLGLLVREAPTTTSSTTSNNII